MLGNAVITAPYKGADRNNITAYIIALTFFLCLSPLIFKLAEKVLCKPNGAAFKKLLFITLIPLILYDATVCFKQFCIFVSRIILPKTPTATVMIIFAITVLFLALKSDTVIYKYALVSFFAVALTVLLFFLLSFKEFSADELVIYRMPDIKSTLYQSGEYLLRVFVPSLSAAVFVYASGNNKVSKPLFIGYGAGSLMLLICILNSFLLFGAKTAGSTDYPYSFAISTVSVGALFTRMDFFAYVSFFITSVIKITVSLKAVKLIFDKTVAKTKLSQYNKSQTG